MQDNLRSPKSVMNRGIKKIKSGLYDLVHHQKTKEFFDHKSSTSWKGAIAICFITVLLAWFPLVYIAAIIQFCVRGPVADFLFERFYEPVFFDDSDLVAGMLTQKEGSFYDWAVEPVRVFLFAIVEVVDLVAIAVAMYLFRKQLRSGLQKLTNKLPNHFKPYSIPITTTVVFTFGWAAVRSPYPYIFGIIWNIVFPALVGILTWFTIEKQDFLVQKSKKVLELREKIPPKFRILALFGFTLLLSYIMMAIMPNKGTQFKEQLIVLISVFLGWLLSVEYSSQQAEGESPGKSLLSSLAIAILFIIVTAPVGAADPFDEMHPHDELEADKFYPGELYPTTQGTIIGIFGCGVGANVHFLIKLRNPEEENNTVLSSDESSGNNQEGISDTESGTGSEEDSGIISTLSEMWRGIKQEFGEAGDQISEFTQEGVRIIQDGQFWLDTITGSMKTIYDASDQLVNKTSGEDVIEGAKKVGNTIVKIGKYAMDEPVEFLLSLTPLEALENSFDPDKTLLERMGNLTLVYLEGVGLVLSGGTASGVKAGGKVLILGENAEGVKDLQKLLNKKDDLDNPNDIKIGRTIKVKGEKLEKRAHTIEPEKALTPEVVKQRKNDWQTALAKADSRLKEYREALSTEPIDYERVDKAMIELKRDKIGMTLANKDLPDSEKQIFNQRTSDLHMKVDTDIKDFAVDKFNLGKLEGPVQTPEGKVWTNPETKEQFIAVETTNPTNVVKIGSDRDITYRVVKLDENGQLVKSDIDRRFVRPKYEESYHKNSRAQELGYDESPAEFTHRSDQANTDMNDPEAYERDMISGAKFVNEGATSTDSQLLADTSGHKTAEWLARGDSGEGLENNRFEAWRNLTKQQDKQYTRIRGQLKELNPDHHLLKERTVDGNMAEKMGTRRVDTILDELRKLREDPRSSKSPVEIEKMMKDEGFTDVSDFNQYINTRTGTFEQAVKYQRGLKNE